MSHAHWSLLDLVPDASPIPETDKAAGKRSDGLAELGKAIEKELDLPCSTAWGRLNEGLGTLTDIPLDEVLLSAWTHYSELVRLANQGVADGVVSL